MFEEENTDYVMNAEELNELFKQDEEGNYDVMGFTFSAMEVAQARDFYVICEQSGIFFLPQEDLVGFLDFDTIDCNIGAKLILALILKDTDSGVFLLKEDDKRLIGVSKKRLRNEKYGLDLDSDIVIP